MQASDVPESKQKEFVNELKKSMEVTVKKRMANPKMKVRYSDKRDVKYAPKFLLMQNCFSLISFR